MNIKVNTNQLSQHYKTQQCCCVKGKSLPLVDIRRACGSTFSLPLNIVSFGLSF